MLLANDPPHCATCAILANCQFSFLVMAYFFPSTPHAGNSAELYAPQNLCVRFPAQGRNLYPAPPSNPQPVSAASPDSPSKAARKNCLCCMGRHRAHTCGLGGRRGRPKGSTCNKRQHSNAGTSSAGAKARTSTPPSALLQRQLHSRRLLEMQQRLSAHSNLLPLQSRVMLPAGTTAISEGAPGPTPGVKCQTTASFAAELLAHYDSVRTALSTDAESSSSSSGSSPHGPPFSGAPFESHTVQQHRPQLFTHEEAAPPYLMRFAMTLFYVDTILRMGTGICATLEFGPPSSLAQPPTVRALTVTSFSLHLANLAPRGMLASGDYRALHWPILSLSRSFWPLNLLAVLIMSHVISGYLPLACNPESANSAPFSSPSPDLPAPLIFPL